MTVYGELKRREELIEAIKTVASMDVNDITNVMFTLMKENEELKQQLNRLKEDKEENEATYEKIINDLKQDVKNANKGLRRKAGGNE